MRTPHQTLGELEPVDVEFEDVVGEPRRQLVPALDARTVHPVVAQHVVSHRGEPRLVGPALQLASMSTGNVTETEKD